MPYQKGKAGFTILELIVVLLVIGILVVLALPSFNRFRERAFDQEAIASLKLMQAAERIYRRESGMYFSHNDIVTINQFLRLFLPAGGNRAWDYSANANGTTTAVRPTDGRTWGLNITEQNATCTGCL